MAPAPEACRATSVRAVVTIVVFAALLGGWLWSTTLIAERLA